MPKFLVSDYLCLEQKDNIDPLDLYLELLKHSPDAFMFESVEGPEKIARYSFLGYKALEIIKSNSYDSLLEYAAQIESKSASLEFFHRGFVGFFTFESVTDIEPSLGLTSSGPSLYMQFIGTMVVFDKVERKIYLISNSFESETMSAKDYNQTQIAELQSCLSRVSKSADYDLAEGLEELKKSTPALSFSSNVSQQAFEEMVLKAKEHIVEGDVFQVVLSRKLSVDLSVDPAQVYRILRLVNPSPYLFLYNVYDFSEAQPRFTLLGSSPEMLVKSSKDPHGDYLAEIRPIAGTYPRGQSLAEDEANAQALLSDPKEIAEHVMLIDLARNDLGRLALAASVKVAQQMIIERYSHVMHIVSSVIAKLKANPGQEFKLGLDLLKACFPAGTLSGAPKIEAIKIIHQLEVEARGSYGGVIGCLGLDGVINTAIMIRTLVIEPDRVHIQAGAGIVADSIPEREYQETYNKASALIKVLNLCNQQV